VSRIGVFGGAFDPIHTGHLAVAQEVVHTLQLDRLLFVPTARPPHRKEGPFASGEARVAMVVAATAGEERFEVWTGEFDRTGPSFTVDTLRSLREEYPGSSLHLIVGADQFSRFHTWSEPEVITKLATLVVVGRSGDDGTRAGNGIVHQRCAVPRIEVSSSQIRERVREGSPIRYLVPDSVVRIIREQGWYKNG
jgi:nicotinate-nucleotide adenylyltransferase